MGATQMKLKNPCEACIVRACCKENCDKKKKYIAKIQGISLLYGCFIACGTIFMLMRYYV